MASFTMKSFLCVAVLSCITLMSGYSKASSCQGTCPSGWITNNGRCFKYVSTKKDWANAEKTCVDMGGNLPSVHNAAEDQFLKNMYKSFSGRDEPFWLGLSDAQKEGMWFWSDGSKVDYTNWNPGMPNNYYGKENCGEANRSLSPQKLWNDAPCSRAQGFICARPDPR